MNLPRSLQRRLLLALGVLLTLLWLGTAAITALLVRHAMEEVFDAGLQETAQRILPLAVADVLEREDDGVIQRLAEVREHDELLAYIVRNAQGRVLLLSHTANAADFAPWSGVGFSQSATHRFYSEEALQGSVRLTVAEPLAHRQIVARGIQMGLLLPLLVVVPLALLAIVWVVRANLAPLRRLRERLAARSARDLSPVPTQGLPTEVTPVAEALNGLLLRLAAAFEAERSFAANAAHELRTPLAGAIAQAQRLQAETTDPAAKARAAEIEATLKRLTRFAERLLQLARAEGGRLRLAQTTDLCMLARLLTDELTRSLPPGRVVLQLPQAPVHSDLDPDVFAILYRNLLENALRHGAEDAPIDVVLGADGLLTVANDGPALSPEALQRLGERFERATARVQGSGLGLSIVHAIAQRTGSALQLHSPRPGRIGGFEVRVALPIDPGSRAHPDPSTPSP